jgi:hypothetical protein
MAFIDEDSDADADAVAAGAVADDAAVADVALVNGDADEMEDAASRVYPEPPITGDPEVDEVIAALAHAVTGPLQQQLDVYDSAYRTLQDRLADVEG